jgi:transcriptional regulator with XRE-family HTH domain
MHFHYIYLMSLTQEIGQRIRKLRVKKKLTQEDIANIVELTPGAYAKIERGETDPSITRLYQIAAILKVDILALLNDEAPKNKILKEDSTFSLPDVDKLLTQMDLMKKDLIKLKSELNVKTKRVRK